MDYSRKSFNYLSRDFSETFPSKMFPGIPPGTPSEIPPGICEGIHQKKKFRELFKGYLRQFSTSNLSSRGYPGIPLRGIPSGIHRGILPEVPKRISPRTSPVILPGMTAGVPPRISPRILPKICHKIILGISPCRDSQTLFLRRTGLFQACLNK